ncbi:hypothetical protein JL108_07720 [Aeromicrobium sp. YIM 150415]|uniref:hypothetical protein n=1 Tax=Aeromicrobium sp. YIM 150415 TaxID=2803912 RepID=UPI001964402C|nr:hypothetical protein [Aeromicrobium sp. YIM 150415]MBM9463333.1 hypothetical protein [Aeromicrobium sp. YIM 150415]
MRGRIALVILAMLLTVVGIAAVVWGEGGWNSWTILMLAVGLLALHIAFLIREYRGQGD